ncbi:MAG: mechanosensitive ion channel family protein [Marinifilaceae bacterium]|jgi:miniconductance mechanosensitive channel|nr:mechanosensitive ion channel family protein [Marinifilaceae bacterium]
MKDYIIDYFEHLLKYFGHSIETPIIVDLIQFISTIIIAILMIPLFKILFNFIIRSILKSNRKNWNKIIKERKIANQLAIIFSIILINYSYCNMAKSFEIYTVYKIIKLCYSTMIVSIILKSILIFDSIYSLYPNSKKKPIKSYTELLRLLVLVFGIIYTIGILVNFGLKEIFTSIAALSAILMIIFKDSISGLAASLQLSINNMIQIDDWIEIPSQKIIGKVVEIKLNLVKIINSENKEICLPISSLLSNSFINNRSFANTTDRLISKTLSFEIENIKFINNSEYKLIIEKEQLKRLKLNVFKNNSSKLINSSSTNLDLYLIFMDFYIKQHKLLKSCNDFVIEYIGFQSTKISINLNFHIKAENSLQKLEIERQIIQEFILIAKEFELKIS